MEKMYKAVELFAFLLWNIVTVSSTGTRDNDNYFKGCKTPKSKMEMENRDIS